jgi:hypothetical protein
MNRFFARITSIYLLLFVIVGVRTVKAQHDPEAPLTEAADKFGVHLEYPAHWTLVAPENSGAILLFPEAHPPINREWFTHGFAVEPFPPSKYTIEDYNIVRSGDARRIAHRIFERMNDGKQKARIIAEESLDLAGVEAYSISYELTPPLSLAAARKEEGLLIVPRPKQGETARCFHLFAPQSEWERFKPILFSILSSARVQDAAQTAEEKPELTPQRSAVYIEPSESLVRQVVQVPAGRFLPFNFTLTRGSALTTEFKVEGGVNKTIKVWLLDATNYQLYQAGQRFSYFEGTSGSVRQIANYTFKVPETNIYYLVLDNTSALMLPRTVDLYAYAILPEPTPEQIDFQKKMTASYQELKSTFVFDDFQISFRHCGVVNAFSNPNVTICSELVENLHDNNLDDAVAFVFFHELGHSLMKLWGLPLYDNEDVADEFATTMTIMGKQQKMALHAAQWWASQTSEQEAMSKLWIDDRHTISPQRARNIIHWLNSDDELVRRWLKLLIPNMQTEALRSMLNDADPRIDKELVRGELGKREYAAQKKSGN